jgi:hypothetical protein
VVLLERTGRGRQATKLASTFWWPTSSFLRPPPVGSSLQQVERRRSRKLPKRRGSPVMPEWFLIIAPGLCRSSDGVTASLGWKERFCYAWRPFRLPERNRSYR